MHENELWQVFNNNGSPIANKGATPDECMADANLVVGNVHIWFWKRSNSGVEVLLQKRSLTKRTYPGWYHISAGGHINVGETPLQAAVRETYEEMGITLENAKLYFVLSTRTQRAPNDIKNVYVYELRGDEEFSYQDGEVESVEWHSLEEFKAITENTETRKLVDMGQPYYEALIATLERLAKN